MIYDLYEHIDKENITILEGKLPVDNMKGLYFDNTIIMAPDLETEVARSCILAEEIGHHETSFGNILDQESVTNIKQESRAHKWAFEKLLPLERFIDAYESRCSNRYETALFLDVTEKFLEDALIHYSKKYGQYKQVGKYIIYFEPLGVMKVF